MEDQGGDPEFGRYLLAVAAFFPRGNLNVVMPTYAPAFKVLSKVRRAAAPPRVVDPATVPMPKWPTVRARICPSGCWEVSTEMGRRPWRVHRVSPSRYL